MRAFWLAVLAFSVSVLAGPLQALDASDSMGLWRGASADEKTKLVTELLKRDGLESTTSSVVKCLDAAAGVPGHAELPIRQVIKACEKDDREPV